MSGLKDLLPAPKQVEIEGKKYPVRGVSLAEFAGMLSRFPLLNALFSGKGPEHVADLLKAGNPAVGAIIAAGCNRAGDEEWEKDAAALPGGIQVKFLAGILPLTMPGGFGPFVADLATVLQALFPPAPDQAKAAALARVTRRRSQLSSNAGAEPTMQSGNSHHGNSQHTAP